MTDPIAVFDIGKTNVKLLVFASNGTILHERRSTAIWHVVAGLAVLDDAALFAWITGALADVAATHGARHVMFATHGCTFGLLDADGLCAPILDYEQAVPEAVEREFERLRPPFCETGTPGLPRGFAMAKHIVWRELRDPTLAARVTHILTYPQFWTWRLCGARVGEISSLGCHTHLWSPARDDYSSLVDRREWRRKLPVLRPAGEIVGRATVHLPSGEIATIAVHNGVHDSNASLEHYRRLVPGRVTLVSTGTWVVVMNPFCSAGALLPGRDMLINVSIGHEPVPTARFMGGREFDLIRGPGAADAEPACVAAVIRRGVFALPSFADGGPFPGRLGGFTNTAGEQVTPDANDRAALACLYVALMTDTVLDLLESRDTIVIDGGLARASVIARLLAALRPQQSVLRGADVEGTARGAAGIALRHCGVAPRADGTLARSTSFDPPLLAAYASTWRRLAARHGPTAHPHTTAVPPFHAARDRHPTAH